MSSFSEHRIKGAGDGLEAIAGEARQILKRWPPSGQRIILSRDGKSLKNDLWFAQFNHWLETPPHELHFFIGGAAGLHNDILAKADHVLSLSGLTFPHTLCRLMLYEQIYRALTIRHGIKYHKTAQRETGG